MQYSSPCHGARVCYTYRVMILTHNNSLLKHKNRVLMNMDVSEDTQTKDELNQDNGGAALQQCQTELQEWKDKCIRVSADFENFKKRQEKERLHWHRLAQVELVTGLLPIIDTIERALKQKKAEEFPAELRSWFEGFQLMDKELEKYLASLGIQEIKDVGTFNPELHEAVVLVKNANVPAGNIVELLQKGYRFKDMVLRPAKVSVAE